MFNFAYAAVAALAFSVGPAVADAECDSVAATAVATPDLSTLVELVTAADLVDALGPNAEITVFAPNNAAFEALGSTTDELSADKVALTAILSDHIVPGKALSTDLIDGQELTTLAGTKLTVGVADGVVTITAPNGGTTATVVLSDIEACESAVHVIDDVLLAGTETAMAPMMAAMAPLMAPSMDDGNCTTIVDAAQATPDLSTLVELVIAADAVDILADPTAQFTVFAPTNAAFQAVGTAEQLSVDTDALAAILLDHVVAGVFSAADLTDGQELSTASGKTLTVSISAGTVTVNGPNGGSMGVVKVPDVMACDSIVHIIDTVLLDGSSGMNPARSGAQSGTASEADAQQGGAAGVVMGSLTAMAVFAAALF